MTNVQFWAIVAFAAILLAILRVMQPAPRKLDGRQKYRRDRMPGRDADPDANKAASMSPVQAALAALFGASIGGNASGESESSQSDGGGCDGGGYDGGGDGGGD